METIYDVVWTSNSGIGRFLVLCIACLAAVAARFATTHTKRYRSMETAQLSNVERTLEEAQSASPSTKGTQKQPPSKGPVIVSIARLRESALPHSIVGDRLSVLAQLRASQVKVSVAALQEVSLARESARGSLRFPSFAVGLLMLMGLLGTFIGIAMIVQNIGVTDTTSLDAVRSQINGALMGMRTKFSTTLVGLFCAIVVSLLNFRLAQAQAAFFQRLDRFTSTQLLPATIPAVEDETLLEKISLQLESSFSRLDDLAKHNVEMISEVKAVQTGFSGVVESLHKNQRSESTERLQLVIGKLSGVMDQVVAMNESVKGMLTNMPRLMAEMSTSVQSLSEVVPKLVQKTEIAHAVAATRTSGTRTQVTRNAVIVGLGIVAVVLTVIILSRR